MTRTRQTPNRLISLAASCMAIFWPGVFIFGFPGIMAPYWQKMFDVGRGEVGRTLFFLLAAVGTFMLVSGRLQERVRPRYLVLFGSILCGSSMFLAGTAKGMSMIYLWAFLTGISYPLSSSRRFPLHNSGIRKDAGLPRVWSICSSACPLP